MLRVPAHHRLAGNCIYQTHSLGEEISAWGLEPNAWVESYLFATCLRYPTPKVRETQVRQ